MTDPIQVLLLAADPRDTSAGLRIDHEIRRSLEAVRMGQGANELKIAAELAVRGEDLVPALLRHRPQIVHFAGHGDGEGLELDNFDTLLPATLVQLFTTFREVRAVVLNACKSLVVAEAVSKVVDYTVAMEASIGDETAVDFAGAFYAALAFGSTVRFAFDAACSTISPCLDEEHPLPRLLVRPGAAEWPVRTPPAPEPRPAAESVTQENRADDVEVEGSADLANQLPAGAAGPVKQNNHLSRAKVGGSLSMKNG